VRRISSSLIRGVELARLGRFREIDSGLLRTVPPRSKHACTRAHPGHGHRWHTRTRFIVRRISSSRLITGIGLARQRMNTNTRHTYTHTYARTAHARTHMRTYVYPHPTYAPQSLRLSHRSHVTHRVCPRLGCMPTHATHYIHGRAHIDTGRTCTQVLRHIFNMPQSLGRISSLTSNGEVRLTPSMCGGWTDAQVLMRQPS
jgi:hypothetical protein